MSIKISTAPCCWGVDDVSNPHLPKWELVLDEAAQAGYKGIELGPYGYMPFDADLVGDALQQRGLSIVAGTIFDDLVDAGEPAQPPAADRRDLQPGHQAAPGGAGRGPALPHPLPGRHRLGARRARLRRRPFRPGAPSVPGGLGRDGGEHQRHRRPRRGTSMASAASSIRMRAATSSSPTRSAGSSPTSPTSTAGLCLDTGHLYYSGMDPVQWLREHARSLDYIHFKDIDQQVFDDVMGRRIRFFDACAAGVMCPIGRGVIDYPAHPPAAARHRLPGLHHRRAGARPAQRERQPRATSEAAWTTCKSVGF